MAEAPQVHPVPYMSIRPAADVNGLPNENILLNVNDVIITVVDGRDFCQILQLYSNSTLLTRILGTESPRLIKAKSILVNLSYIGRKEIAYLKLRRERETWVPGRPVEVFSVSQQNWCVGYVTKSIELRKDPRVVHGDAWFEVVYLSSGRVRYKQIKFDHDALLKDVTDLKDSEEWEPFHELLKLEDQRNLPEVLRETLNISECSSRAQEDADNSSGSDTSSGSDFASGSDDEPKEAVTKPSTEGDAGSLPNQKSSSISARNALVESLDKMLIGTNLPGLQRQSSIDEPPKSPTPTPVEV